MLTATTCSLPSWNPHHFSFPPPASQSLQTSTRRLRRPQERLEREFDLDLITTAPSVVYRCTMNDGTTTMVHNPSDLPDPTLRQKIEEPYCKYVWPYAATSAPSSLPPLPFLSCALSPWQRG